MDTDKEIFDAAMADEAPPPPEAPPPAEAETSEQPRDEHGRFAAKNVAPEPPQATQPDPAPASAPEPPAVVPEAKQQDHRVPLRELLDERERRQEMQRELAALRAEQARLAQQPKEVPDIFTDPQAHLASRIDPLREEMQRNVSQIREDFSLQHAVDKYGPEVVREAYQAMEQTVARFGPNHPDYARVMSSKHPYGELVAWHQRNQTMTRIGGDLDGFLKSYEEKLLSDEAFMQRVAEKLQAGAAGGKSTATPIVQLPPSINRATGSGASQVEGSDVGDMSDASLFRHAVSSRR